MNLFIITPPDGSSLFLCFHIFEAIINLCDYVLITVWFMMIRKMRLNFHPKTCLLLMAGQYYLYLTARLIILGYQSGLLYHKGNPEGIFLLVAASWFKGFYVMEILSITAWGTFERELSLYYIQDYEYRRRYWIPILVMLITVTISSVGISLFTFVFPLLQLPIYPFLFFMFGVSITGLVLFVYNYHRTARLNNTLKGKDPCRLPYTLNVRYQLEENLWLAKALRNAVVVMTFGNVPTAFAFMGAYFPYFSEETRQIMDCLYNICIAANAPLFAFGIFFRNSYFVGLVKSLFAKKNSIDPIEDEGDFYFEQLAIQWKENYSK